MWMWHYWENTGDLNTNVTVYLITELATMWPAGGRGHAGQRDESRLGGTEWVAWGFITPLRMACNLKHMNCFSLEFSDDGWPGATETTESRTVDGGSAVSTERKSARFALVTSTFPSNTCPESLLDEDNEPKSHFFVCLSSSRSGSPPNIQQFPGLSTVRIS